MFNKKLFFLIQISTFTLGMDQQEAKPQKTTISDTDKDQSQSNTTSLKLTHHRDLIDPKTNKPYQLQSDAWDEFWHRAYIRDQKIENRKIEQFLKDSKRS